MFTLKRGYPFEIIEDSHLDRELTPVEKLLTSAHNYRTSKFLRKSGFGSKDLLKTEDEVRPLITQILNGMKEGDILPGYRTISGEGVLRICLNYGIYEALPKVIALYEYDFNQLVVHPDIDLAFERLEVRHKNVPLESCPTDRELRTLIKMGMWRTILALLQKFHLSITPCDGCQNAFIFNSEIFPDALSRSDLLVIVFTKMNERHTRPARNTRLPGFNWKEEYEKTKAVYLGIFSVLKPFSLGEASSVVLDSKFNYCNLKSKGSLEQALWDSVMTAEFALHMLQTIHCLKWQGESVKRDGIWTAVRTVMKDDKLKRFFQMCMDCFYDELKGHAMLVDFAVVLAKDALLLRLVEEGHLHAVSLKEYGKMSKYALDRHYDKLHCLNEAIFADEQCRKKLMECTGTEIFSILHLDMAIDSRSGENFDEPSLFKHLELDYVKGLLAKVDEFELMQFYQMCFAIFSRYETVVKLFDLRPRQMLEIWVQEYYCPATPVYSSVESVTWRGKMRDFIAPLYDADEFSLEMQKNWKHPYQPVSFVHVHLILGSVERAVALAEASPGTLTDMKKILAELRRSGHPEWWEPPGRRLLQLSLLYQMEIEPSGFGNLDERMEEFVLGVEGEEIKKLRAEIDHLIREVLFQICDFDEQTALHVQEYLAHFDKYIEPFLRHAKWGRQGFGFTPEHLRTWSQASSGWCTIH